MARIQIRSLFLQGRGRRSACPRIKSWDYIGANRAYLVTPHGATLDSAKY
jgi:hypothetical protein